MTPRQLALHAKVHNETMQASLENTRMEIYLSAVLTAQFTAQSTWSKKKLPTYEKTFKIKKAVRQMSDKEMLAQVRALNAAFGGVDERGEY